MNYIAGGVGKAIMFLGDQLWGVANTLSDNTFDFTITAEDVRGGKKNVLLGQYFHDPNLAITLTNAMLNYDDVALVLGATIEQGGLSFMEEQVAAGVGGTLTATKTPTTMNGKYLGWYKLPTATSWTVATFNNGVITVPGATQNTAYCLKYFWINPDARGFDIKADYEPSEIHLVILQDLFSAEQQSGTIVPGAKAGTMISDIPRFKLNGNENLAFAAGSTATTSMSGNAIAVNNQDSCEDEFIYGSMTEEITGANWQDNVIALAPENAEIELGTTDTETIIMRAVYGGTMPSTRQPNTAFTFTVDSGSSATVSNVGLVTAGSTTGDTYISVALTNYPNVDPAVVKVTVA